MTSLLTVRRTSIPLVHLRRLRCAGLIGAASVGAVALAGCASQPSRYASNGGRFYDARLGVYASSRLIADGEPVPRGGGSYLVGRPYTIGGRAYYPSERPEGYTTVGMASWYGDAFHGRRTANGEIFDKNSISAAHPTLPLPSYVRVTNTSNGHSMIVRVNDRGPYHGGRVMDVSQRVAEELAFKGQGTAQIRIEYVGRASLDGSDDTKLLATLRVDGLPAQLDGSPGAPTLLADEQAPGAPLPPPAAPQPVAQGERVARAAEQDVEAVSAGEPLPARRWAPAPVPPRRPFDFAPGGPEAVAMPQQRAALDRLIRDQVAVGSPRLPHVVSFAATSPSAPGQAGALPSRTHIPLYRRTEAIVPDER